MDIKKSFGDWEKWYVLVGITSVPIDIDNVRIWGVPKNTLFYNFVSKTASKQQILTKQHQAKQAKY